MLFTTDRWDRECMHTKGFQTIGLGALTAPPAVDMLALARVNEARVESIRVIRAQLASLEQKLKHVQGVSDVATSKCKLSAEREEYPVEELIKTAKDLVCKYKPPSHFSSSNNLILTRKLLPLQA